MDTPPSYESSTSEKVTLIRTNNDPPPLYSSLDKSDFEDVGYRKSFIIKVYTILMIQLGVTSLVCGLMIKDESLHNWVNDHINQLYWPLVIILFVMIIMIGCIEPLRKKAPWNYLALGLVTLILSFITGFVTAQYNTNIVLIAALFTIGVTLALTIFAWATKYDFTGWHPYMLVLLVVLILFGIIGGIFHNQIVNIVYSALSALIFAIYIVIDTQTIIGGNHRYQLAPDEYVMGALALYLDILNFFLSMLQLLARD